MESKLRRPHTDREEYLHALTHGLGAILFFAGGVYLVIMSSLYGTAMHVISSAIYGASLLLLYTASTLYHSAPRGQRRFYKTMDHVCIYLLIAGTYTPLTLLALDSAWGWSLFGVIWGMAFFGIIFKFFFVGRFKMLSTATYLIMGWMAVIAMDPLIDSLPFFGIMGIVLGGLFYTVGAIFYIFDHLPYFHTIFHIFVLAGSLAHYWVVFYFALPLGASL